MSLPALVPTNHVLTSGTNSALTWTNALTLSTVNTSTLNASNLSVSTLATSSLLTASTLTTGRLNYSSIVGSSISSNTLTLSLVNASTQNTQIYQVATTNPTTSYTVIQASHVSTGTTNNALALNPSGGNVGVGTTAPGTLLDVNGSTQTRGSFYAVNTNNPLGTTVGNSTLITQFGPGSSTDYGRLNLYGVRNGTGSTWTTTSFMLRHEVDATNFTYMGFSANGVGIGTTNPLCQLYLNGGAGTTGWVGQTYIGNTTRGVILGTLSNIATIGGHTAALGAWADLSINTGGGNVGIGTATPSATLQVNGSLAKSSGTFDIEHPLHIGTNKRLVHSFIEGPRCDLIYRGKTTLINGSAVVNIDKECTQSPECAMDEGTFEALCNNPQIFLQNNKTFDRVRGVVSGATLTITCETPAAVEIEWMVIAERADPFIKQWDRTNPDGYLITQYGGASAPIPPSSGVEEDL